MGGQSAGHAGSTNALKSLTISSAAQSDLANVIATGVIAVTSTNIDLNGTVYTSGDDITLTGNVDLDSTGTLTITGGGVAGEDVTVTGTIDDTASNSDLVIVAALGAVNLQGNAGSTNALKSLTISSAAQSDLANVIATGVIAVTSTNIDLNGTVYTSGDDITLTGNVDLDSTGTLTITGGGVAGEDITVTGTIDDTASDSDLVIVGAWVPSICRAMPVAPMLSRA